VAGRSLTDGGRASASPWPVLRQRLPKRSQKEGAAIPSLTPLSTPQFRGPVGQRRPHPEQSCGTSAERHLEKRMFRGMAPPQRARVTQRKQSAFLPIDCPRTGAIQAEPACGAQNRCPLALWASRLQAGGIRDCILHPSRLDSPQPPTPSVVQHGRAGLQPHVEHPLAGLCASRRDLQLTTGKSMTVRREASKE
jgi:hypothetical protein